MGAQLSSKGGVTVEAKAAADPAAAKANGQENGHVKTNGDVSAKPEGEVAATDGNGTAEPAKEGETAGDAIESAPAAEGEAVKAEGEAAKDGKKKKKFSLKNSFKFKGISLKKSKKGSEEGKEEATSPTTEDKPEENGHAAKETKEETPAAEAKEGEAAAAEPAAAPADDAAPAPAPEGETKAAEEAARLAVSLGGVLCQQADPGWHGADLGLQLRGGQRGGEGAALLLWIHRVQRKTAVICSRHGLHPLCCIRRKLRGSLSTL